MGARRRKVPAKRASKDVLMVGWAPSKKGQRVPFDPKTYSGGRVQKLAGVAASRFAEVENLIEVPVLTRDDLPPAKELRRRAVEVLRKHPGLPLILVGKDVARAFGLRVQLQRHGFLEWFNAGERVVAVLPHPSGKSYWWNEKANVEKARLFLREVAEGTPFGDTEFTGPLIPIDPAELQRLCASYGPTVAEAASHFDVTARTLYSRLEDQEYRDAWETGHAKHALKVRKVCADKGLKGQNVEMLKVLRKRVLGEKDDQVPLPVSLTLTSGEDSLVPARELRRILAEVAQQYGVENAEEIIDVTPKRVGSGRDVGAE